MITDFIGYAATAVGTCLMLPQVIKAWKTREMKDVSLGMVVLYIGNCALWLIYGLLIAAMPVVIANGIGLVIGIIQFALKRRLG